MFDLGTILNQQGKSEDAVIICREMVERFKDSDLPKIKNNLAKGMVLLVGLLIMRGQGEEAISVYREIKENYENTYPTEVQMRTAFALAFLGVILKQEDQIEVAFSMSREMMARFKKTDQIDRLELLLDTILILGEAFERQGRVKESVSIYQEAIENLKDLSHPELQKKVARVMSSLGNLFGKAGNIEEAKMIFQEWISFLKRFESVNLEHLEFSLKSIVRALPIDLCRNYFKQLEDILKGDAINYLRLFGYILDVLETQERVSAKKLSVGPGVRLRKSLALVPPELRETVKEAVDGIMKEKRRIIKQKTQKKRKV